MTDRINVPDYPELANQKLAEAREKGHAARLEGDDLVIARQKEREAYPARYVTYGKPLTIAVFLAESPWGEIDDSAMGKGLGGRETALVHLAMEWAKLGHDVYAFVPRSTTEIIEYEETGGKVRWIPNTQVREVTHAVQPDAFISWENVAVLTELDQYTGITGIEMQVAHLNSHVPVDEVADYIFVLSKWAGRFIQTQHEIDDSRVIVFPNGVDLARFEDIGEDGKWSDEEFDGQGDGEMHFIYSSSPDRGLHHILKMWPQLQQSIQSQYDKKANLHICYGIENFVQGCRGNQREDGLRALDIEALIGQPGVIYHGKVGQDELATLMAGCDLMLYPCDTMSPTETGCISIIEALAAGTPVVTTDCDCIGEDYPEVTRQVPLPFLDPPPSYGNYPGSSYSEYVAAVLQALEPEDYQANVEVGQEFVLQRDWGYIAKQWVDFLSQKINPATFPRETEIML